MFERLGEAKELKGAGNGLFLKNQFAEAAARYNDALVRLPPAGGDEENEAHEAAVTDQSHGGVSLDEHLGHEETIALRTVLHCNLAACYLKLEQYKDAVEASTLALRDDENNVKALHRRACAYEGLGKWNDLEKALKDYQKLAELDREGYVPSDYGPELRAALERVPRAIQVAGESEKNEMFGKLKGLGNSILGYFGLSTDNFKMSPQAGGGYSVNFEQ